VEDVEDRQVQLVGGLHVLAKTEVNGMRRYIDMHTIIEVVASPQITAFTLEQDVEKPVREASGCKPAEVLRQRLIHRFINNGPLCWRG
jgi:hypothetical protein